MTHIPGVIRRLIRQCSRCAAPVYTLPALPHYFLGFVHLRCPAGNAAAPVLARWPTLSASALIRSRRRRRSSCAADSATAIPRRAQPRAHGERHRPARCVERRGRVQRGRGVADPHRRGGDAARAVGSGLVSSPAMARRDSARQMITRGGDYVRTPAAVRERGSRLDP